MTETENIYRIITPLLNTNKHLHVWKRGRISEMSGIVISNSESSETYIFCRCKIQCQALELVTWGELLAWGATAWGWMHGDTGYPLGCVLCHLSGWKRDGQHREPFLVSHTKAKLFFSKQCSLHGLSNWLNLSMKNADISFDRWSPWNKGYFLCLFPCFLVPTAV